MADPARAHDKQYVSAHVGRRDRWSQVLAVYHCYDERARLRWRVVPHSGPERDYDLVPVAGGARA